MIPSVSGCPASRVIVPNRESASVVMFPLWYGILEWTFWLHFSLSEDTYVLAMFGTLEALSLLHEVRVRV